MKRLCMIIFLTLLFSCSSVPVGDTSRNALDWPGTYRCDDMSITLHANYTYIARLGDVGVRSSFRWDKTGEYIYLNNLKKHTSYKKFKVGENKLIPVKRSGKALKDRPVLKKVSVDKLRADLN